MRRALAVFVLVVVSLGVAACTGRGGSSPSPSRLVGSGQPGTTSPSPSHSGQPQGSVSARIVLDSTTVTGCLVAYTIDPVNGVKLRPDLLS